MKYIFTIIYMSIFISSTAFAHVSLVSSTPADGAVVETSPSMVMLTLSEPARLTGFELVKENDEEIEVGELPKETAAMVHMPLPTLTSGGYTITWRAASKDMHAMSGTITFSVK